MGGFRAEESGVKEREKGSRWRGRVAWGAAAGLLAMGVCVPVAGAGYVFDLAANLSAQGLGLGVVVCGWFLVGRNWRRAAVGGLGCVLMAWPLVGRVWWVEGPGPARPVRVLVFNSSTTAGDAGEAMGLIERSEADVVVLTEPSGALLELVRDSEVLAGRYPGFFLPDRAAGGYMLVLSTWAQVPVLGETAKDVARGGLRVMRFERPEGPFILLALHPDSPRSPAEWAKGNEVVERAAGLLEGELARLGLPLVVGADLNSTPAGWRSRRLGGAGLRRAKPVLAGGTWPAGWPWPLSVAIDDVWMSRDCRVAGWDRPLGGGSDHRAVLVEVIVGQAGAPAGR